MGMSKALARHTWVHCQKYFILECAWAGDGATRARGSNYINNYNGPIHSMLALVLLFSSRLRILSI